MVDHRAQEVIPAYSLQTLYPCPWTVRLSVSVDQSWTHLSPVSTFNHHHLILYLNLYYCELHAVVLIHAYISTVIEVINPVFCILCLLKL